MFLRGRLTNTVMSWEVASSQHLVSFSSEQLSYLVKLKLSCASFINLETQTARELHVCSTASCTVDITISTRINLAFSIEKPTYRPVKILLTQVFE